MSRYLLDTHVYLWLTSEPHKVPEETIQKLDRTGATVMLSIVSAWEIAIKHGMGRLDLELPLNEFLFISLAQRGIELLPIEPKHIVRYATLDFPDKEHRDPFDRMLVSQAIEDGLTLVTQDEKLSAYPIDRL